LRQQHGLDESEWIDRRTEGAAGAAALGPGGEKEMKIVPPSGGLDRVVVQFRY
jgi:hypothetical protein